MLCLGTWRILQSWNHQMEGAMFDWHNCFCMSSWGSILLDPKKLQNEQFYIIDWIRKKLLVDVANLAPCCHDDYDVLLEVLGTHRQVSTHRRFLISISSGMHKLFAQRRRVLCLWVGAQRAQNLPNSFSPGRTTVPDAMLMSRCQSWSMLC